MFEILSFIKKARKYKKEIETQKRINKALQQELQELQKLKKIKNSYINSELEEYKRVTDMAAKDIVMLMHRLAEVCDEKEKLRSYFKSVLRANERFEKLLKEALKMLELEKTEAAQQLVKDIHASLTGTLTQKEHA